MNKQLLNFLSKAKIGPCPCGKKDQRGIVVYPSLKNLQFDEEEAHKIVILHNVKYMWEVTAIQRRNNWVVK